MPDIHSNQTTFVSETQSVFPRADVLTNLFLNPPSTGSNGPDNSIWVLGTTQHVRWATNISTYNFLMYQQLVCKDNNCVQGPFLIAENLTNETTSWDWQVTTGTLTLKPTNNFFLIMRDVDNELNQFGSSYLNFTSSVPVFGLGSSTKTALPGTTESSSTPSISSSTATRTSDSITPTTTNKLLSIPSTPSIPGPTSTAASTASATSLPVTSPSGLSLGAKAGIIIGAICVVIIAIFVGWYLGRRRQISRKSPFHPPTSPARPIQLSELHVPGWSEQKPIAPPFTPRELHSNGKFDNFTGVRELDGWDKVIKLDAGRRSRMKSGIYELGPRYT